jgi:hypothetical protein
MQDERKILLLILIFGTGICCFLFILKSESFQESRGWGGRWLAYLYPLPAPMTAVLLLFFFENAVFA